MASLNARLPSLGWRAGLAANLLVIGVYAVVTTLRIYREDVFYRAVQEDEALEWATFWAFLLAAGVCALGASRQWRSRRQLPWFLSLLGLFCFFVAMEEISWGQRVLGYQPPGYFLEHNTQLEFNLHNWASTLFRTTTLRLFIGGYGILLPLAAVLFASEGQLGRFGIVVSPAALMPSFVVMLFADFLDVYQFDREVVELMLGLGVLIAVVVAAREYGSPSVRPERRALAVGLTGLVVAVLGVASAALSGHARSASPEARASARVEVDALQRDFLSHTHPRGCGLHTRLANYVRTFEVGFLREGEFAALTERGLPPERAEFFLDPWNSPYWLSDKCAPDGSRRVVVVYSMGPNRRRDSYYWKLEGDDIGSPILDEAPMSDAGTR